MLLQGDCRNDVKNRTVDQLTEENQGNSRVDLPHGREMFQQEKVELQSVQRQKSADTNKLPHPTEEEEKDKGQQHRF